MFNINNKRYKRGFTLLEVMFVLGIMAIVIASATILEEQSRQSLRTNEAISEVVEIVGVVHDMTANANDYTKITTDVISKSGLFPNRYINNKTGLLTNPFGGSIYLDTSESYEDIPVVKVTTTGLLKSACLVMTTQNIGDQPISLEINGSSVGILTTSHPYLTTNEAESKCNSNNNNITYTFH